VPLAATAEIIGLSIGIWILLGYSCKPHPVWSLTSQDPVWSKLQIDFLETL